MYVNDAQKFFTYSGYYANAFARGACRNIESLTRPMPHGEAYWREVGKRTQQVIELVFSLPLAVVLSIPSIACYGLAAYVGRGRFDLIEPHSPASFWPERSLKVISLNACFQDPWSPLTGGVVTPFELVANSASRIAAVVNALAEEDPTIYLGQEFDNLGAQDECIRLMRQKGFSYFLRDLGSNDPIRNHSGLFIASKVPLQNIEFIPYPSETQAGLAKWSNQGALTFTVSLQGKNVRFVNVHLNYGEGEENQNARNRQLTRHVIPLLNRGPSVLLGDLNFDTAQVDRELSGLRGFTNALEGMVTCTDEGKHTLRGKDRRPDGRLCTDCQEQIDGLVYDPNQVQVLNCRVKPLKLDAQLLSDHYATIATVQAQE